MNREGRRLIIRKLNNKILLDDIIDLKYKFTDDEAVKIISNLNHKAISTIFSNPKPTNSKKLFSDNLPIFKSSIEKEISWYEKKIYYFYNEINSFIKLQNDIERTIIDRREYDINSRIDTFNKLKGYSLWLVQTELLLEELFRGTTENQSLLRKKQEIFSTNTNIFLSYFSYRYEKNINSDKYNSFLRLHYENYRSDDTQLLKTYVAFKLDPFFNTLTIEELIYILQFDHGLSVYDNYETLIHIFSIIATKISDKNALNSVLKACKRFQTKIIDSRIENIISKIENKTLEYKKDDFENITNAHINAFYKYISTEIRVSKKMNIDEKNQLSNYMKIEQVKKNILLYSHLNFSNVFYSIFNEYEQYNSGNMITSPHFFSFFPIQLLLNNFWANRYHISSLNNYIRLLESLESKTDNDIIKNDLQKYIVVLMIYKNLNFQGVLSEIDKVENNIESHMLYISLQRIKVIININQGHLDIATRCILNNYFINNETLIHLQSTILLNKILKESENIDIHTIEFSCFLYLLNQSDDSIYDSMANFLIAYGEYEKPSDLLFYHSCPR